MRMIILFLLFLIVMSGCASFDNTYMGSSEFRTVEECRIAYKLHKIDKEVYLNCQIQLPETLW